MKNEFPSEGVELTFLLVVSDIEKSKTFYKDILGAEIYREYGGSSIVLKLLGNWLLIVTGGTTEDKPDITFSPPADKNIVTHQLTFRVPDCKAAYEVLKSRGAEFLTPPVDRGGEVRCFFHDPDGHMMEISQIY